MDAPSMSSREFVTPVGRRFAIALLVELQGRSAARNLARPPPQRQRRSNSLEMALDHDTVFWVGWTLLGGIVGSFLNAFVYRWPRRISLVKRTRSFCPSCEATIAWYDNIPILSYLILLGRCRSCKTHIRIRYLALEVLTMGLFSLAYYQGRMQNPEVLGWAYVIVLSVIAADLLALSFVDIETYTVPFVNSLSLIAIGFIIAPVWGILQLSPTMWTHVPWLDCVLNSLQGIILGGGAIWAVGAAAELILRKEAMGGGDVKILAGVGAVFGWKAALAAFLVAVFIGAFTGVALIVWDKMSVRLRKKRIGVTGIEKGITYKYEADEEPPLEDTELVKSRKLMLIGLIVAAEQAGMLLLLPGASRSVFAAVPLLFGITIGIFAVFYDMVRRRLVNEDRWIKRNIVKDAEGKTEEHLSGHYLPFGPFLAAAALLMLFAGNTVLAWLAERFFPAL
jgi:leader peptidase (prepilin peptidase)/N-methyltransferase